jgi:hypothetical protein
LWENLVAKRDLVLKNLDKTPAEMPKNFKSATSVCDLSGAEKDNTVNEMAKLRAELKFTKTQQLAAGAAASEVQRTTSTAPRRRLRLQQRQAPQETQGKYQGTFVTTVGEHGSIIVQSLTLNLTLGAGVRVRMRSLLARPRSHLWARSRPWPPSRPATSTMNCTFTLPDSVVSPLSQ